MKIRLIYVKEPSTIEYIHFLTDKDTIEVYKLPFMTQVVDSTGSHKFGRFNDSFDYIEKKLKKDKPEKLMIISNSIELLVTVRRWLKLKEEIEFIC